jgi:hypothetical protein
VDFGEVDLTLAGVAFLLLFGGDVMDLVAGEFDFCLFVAVGVVLPLETLLFLMIVAVTGKNKNCHMFG